MVSGYKEAKDGILAKLKENASLFGVKESAIIEAGREPSALPSPFIYCVFDYGESKAHGGFVCELITEIYVGVKAKNAAEAKEKADEIASKVLSALIASGTAQIQQGEKFKEFFAESANRAGVKITLTNLIRSH